MRKGLGNIVAWGLFEYLVDKRSNVYIDWLQITSLIYYIKYNILIIINTFDDGNFRL